MDVQQEIERAGQTKHLPAGAQLFTFEDSCDYYVLVLEGQVRVELSSTTGQQMILYRIYQQQSCVLTTSCLMSGDNYSAQAIAETDIIISLLAARDFNSMLAESAEFRQFVFNGFSERLAAMMQRTNELVTHSIDQRLAAVLIARSELERDPVLRMTHEELAIEIGTAREVVSRRLGLFERDGLIQRHRRHLEILDTQLLKERLAQ